MARRFAFKQPLSAARGLPLAAVRGGACHAVAGDAAGFIDPMTDDGLRFAVRGGELAALSALRALEQGWTGVHASLDAVRRQEFQGKWRFNRILRGLVGSPAGVRGATLGSRVAPGIVRALIRHASDCHLAAH